AERQGDYASAHSLQAESLTIWRELGARQGSAWSLEAFASLYSAQKQTERGVRLWGAAEVLRETIGMPLPPNEREEYDRKMAAARQALGNEAFTNALTEGRAMTWEQAIKYALDEAMT